MRVSREALMKMLQKDEGDHGPVELELDPGAA